MRDAAPSVIDARLVSQLIADQFPHWAAQPVRAVARSGWDNRTFRVGNGLLARLPSQAIYAAQVEVEQRWLPVLAPQLSLPIPQPVALGQPGHGYPWCWSIYNWLPGEAAALDDIANLDDFTADLAAFLLSLQAIDASGGPPAGAASFFRGGDLAVYDAQCRAALAALTPRLDAASATHVWDSALTATRHGTPVWVHGDIALGNLLLSEGRLAAVIDFGQLAVGDPACDYAIAWTVLREPQRAAFRRHLNSDLGTWQRGRAWALWKAAIVAAGICDNASDAAAAWRSLDEIVMDAARTML